MSLPSGRKDVKEAMPRIELNDVSLSFRVRRKKNITLKEYLLRGGFLKGDNTRLIHALSHVNLNVTEGDRLGIIGHNGAGKSTLLRLIAGIYPPSTGRRIVSGRICSLFDIALGFEADASGWDNIAYRSYLQGETPRTLRPKLQGIAEFSELGDFLDLPVRYYSAGMMIRLAFSIATAVEPEILLIDEVLSVGDLSFQHKAQQRMQEMMRNARLMVVVTHDLHSLESLCNKAIWLDHGSVNTLGSTREVIRAYRHSVGETSEAEAA